MSDKQNIFEQITELSQKRHKIGISLVDHSKIKRDKDGKAENLKELGKDNVVFFEIITPTPLIEEQADAITATLHPPKIYETVPNENKIGSRQRMVGHDYEDPKFKHDMEKLEMDREIFICLSCCPQLEEDTKGTDIKEKIKNLKAAAPRSFIAALFSSIADLGAHNDDADFFLTKAASPTSPRSRGSKTARKATKKKKSTKK